MQVGMDRHWTARFAAGICLAAGLAVFWSDALAGSAITVPPEIAQRLSPQQLATYRSYLASRLDFDNQKQIYWKLVEERRDWRRRKYATRQPYVLDDYVLDQPPKYSGPQLPADINTIVATAPRPTTPTEPETPLPSLNDFLEQARNNFNFIPERIDEHEFKRRYAAGALAAGLTKDQVVRVYALETGGRGTYDMQAGIDPDTKQGRPISSAMGYAQLLSANSVDELRHNGSFIIGRLEALGTPSGKYKAAVLRDMIETIRTVPDEWSAHQQFAKTPRGQGIHAINLDGDIGPMLQVVKLKGLLETASKEAGRTNLAGAELEMMNLAGPRTGLEMLQSVGRTVPTANFFAEAGYYRNTIVREKTGAELLKAIDERMQSGLVKPGAIDFSLAFDEVLAGLQSNRTQASCDPAPRAFGASLYQSGR